MTSILFIGFAYLLGSVPFAVLVSKIYGLPDPRTYGSNNPGATNVLRTGKKKAAALTLLGDAGKGFLAVMLARYFIADSNWTVAFVALAVFLGHLFPLVLRFKGGKGVATALGVLLALNVMQGLIALAIWLAVAFTLRYSSLAALAAALSASIYALLHMPGPFVFASLVMTVLLFWRHADNIRNLVTGKESKIGA